MNSRIQNRLLAAAAIFAGMAMPLCAQLTVNGMGQASVGAGLVSASAEAVNGGPAEFNSDTTGVLASALFTTGIGGASGFSLATGGAGSGEAEPVLKVQVANTSQPIGNFNLSASVEYQFAVYLPHSNVQTSVTLAGSNIFSISEPGQDVDTNPGAIFPTASANDFVYVSTTPQPSFSFPNTVDVAHNTFESDELAGSPSNLSSQITPITNQMLPFSDTFNVTTNTVYYVNLQSNLSSDGGTGSLTLLLDPLLTLNAQFEISNPGAELILSAGFENSGPSQPPPMSAVPEPSTYGIAAAAALALVALARRTPRNGLGRPA